MDLAEFLSYIVSPVGLGVVTTYIVQLLQKKYPGIAGDLAFLVSALVAAVAGLGSYYLIPFAVELPPGVGVIVMSVLTWVANYILHRFFIEVA